MNVAMDMGTTASRSGNETVVGDGDMDMDAMLEMRQVTKRYENFTLDHVDFVVPKGYVTGLIGENGAGKTTLMKAALGSSGRRKERSCWMESRWRRTTGR